MLQAFLRGKLSRQEENLEDLLTSNVFGLLSYLEVETGILPTLFLAKDVHDNAPLKDLSRISTVSYQFWPQLAQPGCYPCEPDVLIEIVNDSGSKKLILIEAKYLSGKSSEVSSDEMPTDQLAREWDNLLSLSSDACAAPYLIYVTAHVGIPRDEIIESAQEYRRKRGCDPRFLWLSWRKIWWLFRNSKNVMLRDMVSLLEKINLVYFGGIRLDTIIKAKWEFKPSIEPPKAFNWKCPATRLAWKFNPLYLPLSWRQFKAPDFLWRVKT